MPISKEALKDKMKDPNTVVLNVLPAADFAQLHIQGSENLPIGEKKEDFVQAVEKKYGKNKFFVTYCAGATCNAGPDAAQSLKEKGFKAVEFVGGMREWASTDYPTAGTEAKAAVASK
jgi:rhodanese-related sulfurtransferase